MRGNKKKKRKGALVQRANNAATLLVYDCREPREFQVDAFFTHDTDVTSDEAARGYLERHVFSTHGTVQPGNAHLIWCLQSLNATFWVARGLVF